MNENEGKYGDIIGLEHPTSKRHPRMPMMNRAAQFAPFAALTGYDAAIEETARWTDQAVEMTETVSSQLDRKLAFLLSHLDRCPSITVTYFQPDTRKSGGRYQRFSGTLKRVDALAHTLVFEARKSIPLNAVLELESPLFDEVADIQNGDD